MKHHVKASFLGLALTSGLALAGPPATQVKIPSPALQTLKIDMTSPQAFACPVVSAEGVMAVPLPWTRKLFVTSGIKAQSVYTQSGVAHDSCWCVYRAVAANVPGSETNFLLERETTTFKPICQADSATMSFKCYPLKPGQFY